MTHETQTPRRYPSPDKTEMVANAISKFVREKADDEQKIQAQQERIEELEARLFIDKMTGLYNREAFSETLEANIDFALKNNAPIALMLPDIDGLKRTNDVLGHQVGDKLIIAIADALKAGSRRDDTAGRLAGDEFYVIMPGYAHIDGAKPEELFDETEQRYSQPIRNAIAELNIPNELAVDVSIGIGVISVDDLEKFRQDNKTNQQIADELYKRADLALYEKKELRRAELAKRNIKFEDDRQLPNQS